MQATVHMVPNITENTAGKDLRYISSIETASFFSIFFLYHPPQNQKVNYLDNHNFIIIALPRNAVNETVI